jgi:succinoglycan biosynthesis protein ExoU
MNRQSSDVVVIIAAYNSSRTIARAVSSALNQQEVQEVIVVDDASEDGTAAAANAADDGSGRLSIITLEVNVGPAAARNRAIKCSGSGNIAILDADDYFLPNRFAAIFSVSNWDLIADNIAFVSETSAGFCGAAQELDAKPAAIGLVEFVEGNISRPGRPRAELGFIKPVMRRDFLMRASLRYDEKLRLGEDYALYATMLAEGARFLRCKPCGYVAVERLASLSARHETRDLEALLEFDERFLRHPRLSEPERRAVGRHRAHLLAKVHHRRILDRRREGLLPALRAALARPSLLPQLAMSVARDKLRTSPRRSREEVRYLFN